MKILEVLIPNIKEPIEKIKQIIIKKIESIMKNEIEYFKLKENKFSQDDELN